MFWTPRRINMRRLVGILVPFFPQFCPGGKSRNSFGVPPVREATVVEAL